MVHIRPALPSDAPYAADVQFAAFRTDELNNWLCPRLDAYPHDLLRSMRIRQRFAMYTPANVVNVAVADSSDDFAREGEIIGFATWNRRGRDEAQEKWRRDCVSWKVERWSLGWEKWYQEKVMDCATDWERVGRFFAHVGTQTLYDGLDAYWHLNVIAVHPKAQRQNVGSMLLDWGLKTAREEGVPVTLEAAPTAKRLYWKAGFKTFEELTIPRENLQPAHAMLWEPEALKGKWLETDDEEKTTLKGYVPPVKEGEAP